MKDKFPHATRPASAVTSGAAAAAAVAQSARAAQRTSARGRPRKAKPYQIEGRSGWWANPTLPNGSRPLKAFASEEAAADWIEKMYALAAQTQQPALGGPDVATLAQALYKYAFQFTVVKGGAEAELTRINNYLQGGGLPTLRLAVDAQGRRKLELSALGVIRPFRFRRNPAKPRPAEAEVFSAYSGQRVSGINRPLRFRRNPATKVAEVSRSSFAS